MVRPRGLCMVPSCGVSISDKKVACPFHWSLVPTILKDQLWELAKEPLYEGGLWHEATPWNDVITAATQAAQAGELKLKGG